MSSRFRLVEVFLITSLMLIFAFLIVARPSPSFLVLLLIPITLAAVRYEFVGGAVAALVAMLGAALWLALDPYAPRRAENLRDAWPILVTFLAVGPLLGWFISREREREYKLAETTRRLDIVREIVQAINTSVNPQDTLQTIIAETRRLIPFDRAALLLRSGSLLRVVATSDNEPEGSALLNQAFEVEETAAGLAVQQGQIWFGDPAQVKTYPDSRQLCLDNQSSCLITPLRFQNEVIGVFSLVGRNLDQLPDSYRDDLRQIVDQTAIAIEHARLYQLEHERARAFAAISEAGSEIAASLDLERTLQLVMSKAAGTLPMDAGALFVFDESDQLYRVAVSHNLPPEQVDKITFAFDEGVPGWAVTHRQALIINDARADSRVHPYVVEVGVRSVLAVPLITREQLMGVLNLFSLAGENAFDEEALRLAQVYANQAAVFIENARLVEELRQAAAELEARVEQRTRELRTSQEQVIRAEKMAAVGRLAGSVAHEVNNPLQAITLHLQPVAEEIGSQSAQEQIDIVQHELGRIAEIVQRLLEFQRPKLSHRSRQRIGDLLEEVLALTGKQAQQARVSIHYYVEDDLPPVMAAGDQVKQVFLNLILNAIEAMPDGGKLTIRGFSEDDHLIVSFTDTGPGMAPEKMDQLFEPFFSTKHAGTGLGLAVSQEIISGHGGQLEAANHPEFGAVFTVTLPVEQEDQALPVF